MKPKKSYGQNFLQDNSIVEKIITASDIKPDSWIVEIGPGLGALTFPLSEQKSLGVLAIEADPELSNQLRDKVRSNVRIITGNALDVDWTIEIDNYLIVANLPYSITSPLIRKCLSLSKKPISMTVMIQKEVGERLIAKPGDSERGFLTLLCEAQTTIEKICLVPPSAFWPQPSVDSMVVKLTFGSDLTPTIFWPIVEAGFRHKRQMLVNAISSDLMIDKSKLKNYLQEIGVSLMARPSDLSFANWQKLSQYFIKS